MSLEDLSANKRTTWGSSVLKPTQDASKKADASSPLGSLNNFVAMKFCSQDIEHSSTRSQFTFIELLRARHFLLLCKRTRSLSSSISEDDDHIPRPLKHCYQAIPLPT